MEFDHLERQILDLDRGSLLVTGPPGSGKTTLLRERFAKLVRNGADPDRVALFALSRRAAREAGNLLIRDLGMSVPDLPVFTVHGFSYRTVVRARFAELAYEGEPNVLSAPEQYAAVRDMLGVERRDDWPRLGHLLTVPAFARRVADFVLRCQERLLQPEDVDAMVETGSREDFRELGRFYRRYLDALGAAGQVDFAGLLAQAVSVLAGDAAAAPFDHVLVDDYQDVTHAAEAIIGSIGASATSVVIAADPDGHVFSYRGGSLEPLHRVSGILPGVETVALERSHRLGRRAVGLQPLADPSRPAADPGVSEVPALQFAHPGEEAEAVVHELLRSRIDDDVSWGAMAVLLRRYGPYLTALRHALTRHGVPFVVVSEQAALATEPVIRPIVDLLRYAFRPELREQLLEPLLGSPVGGLDPHALRRLRREARIRDRTLLALVHDPVEVQTLPPDLAERVASFHQRVAELEGQGAGESLDEVFFSLWSTLPYLGDLVAGEAVHQRELDAMAAFAATIGRFVERRPEATIEDYLDTLDAAEFGPDPWVLPEERRPDAVRVISAHRAQGMEFDTVIVVGCLEGEFPSLTDGPSLLSLDSLVAPKAPGERIAARLAEERALFRLAVSRARRRTLLFASRSTGSRTPRSPSRFAERIGSAWTSALDGSAGPATSLRGMEASLRRRLASPAEEPAARLAAGSALAYVDARPEVWWGWRDWSDPGGPLFDGPIKTSYSRLSVMENCALQYLYSVELGLDPDETYQMWVGSRVHAIVDRVQRGEITRDFDEMCGVLDAEWRADIFPNRAVEHRRYLDARDMLWRWLNFEHPNPMRSEVWFEFPIDSAIIRGRIDAVFPMENGHLRVVDYKTSRYPITEEEAKTDLQLAAYYLAVKRTPDLAELGPPGYLQLAYLGKGHQREGFVRRGVSPFTQPGYEDVAERRILELVGRIRSEGFAPNPEADCQFCSFKSICPRWPEGGEATVEEAQAR